MPFVLIAGARPEEAAETVAFRARNDVDVEVGDALADLVVERHEGSLGSEGRLHGEGEESGVTEEDGGEFVGEFGEIPDVAVRNEKNMAGEEGAVIEEGKGGRVFEN